MIRHNLCTNPSAEVDLTGWDTTNTHVTLTRDTTVHNSGVASVQVINTNTQLTNGQGVLSAPANVVGGETYAASVWWNIQTALSVPYGIVFRWFDSGGVPITSSSVTSTIQAVGSGTFTFSALAPDNAATVQVKVQSQLTNTADDTFWIDTVLIEKANSAGAYFDGDTVDDFNICSWDGTANESTSTATPIRHNLCPNPSAEVDLTGWAKTNSIVTMTRDTSVHSDGVASVKVVNGIQSGNQQGVRCPMGAASPGKTYTGSAWINVATTLSVNYVIVLRFFDASKTLLSTTPGGTIFNAVGTYIVSQTAVAPANTAFVEAKFESGTPNTTTVDTFWVDNVLLEEGPAVNSYFDGNASDAFYTYSWDGTAEESASTAVAKSPTLVPSTRTWRYPDLRNGTTIHHVTDTHFGTLYWPVFVQDFLNRAQDDIEVLKVAINGGHLHTGDIINWFVDVNGGESGTDAVRQTEEGAYIAWRDAIKANDGLVWAEVCGNHDLLGVKDANGLRPGRTSQDWATAMGLSQPNNAYDFGDFRVLTVTPDRWLPDSSTSDDPTVFEYVLSTATTDWLDAQLTADSRPTFVAAHVTFTEQYGDDGSISVNSTNVPVIYDIVGAHTNLIGWLSGHRHNGVANNQWAEVLTISGRQIFVVCGPGGGSGPSAAGNAWSKAQFGSYVYASYLTLLDENTLDIRVRDHLAKSWASIATTTETHRLLTRV